jgi:orotate phosphoribosyltransferase
LGGVVIGHETARALDLRAYFAERQGESLALRRGFELKPGERVLLVEDVVTTGKSVLELARLVRARGAEPAGVLAVVSRAEREPELGAPLLCLLRMPARSWTEVDCPLCRQGLPAVKPGSRPDR